MVPSTLFRGGAARPLRVLVVAAEIYPLAKTGGLADVVSALAKALAEFGTDSGIDSEIWNPAGDPHLAQRYARADCGATDAGAGIAARRVAPSL